jgi:amino acid adenylation domain-containing protein
VGPEVVVGLLVERSVEMVVGLLGILKAGGAYLPLDPGYPPERLSYMLGQAGVTVLLSQRQLSGQVPASAAAVVRLDEDWAEISRESVGNSASAVGAENLAYVIYTSGSTGQPKGVMIPHRGICNRLFWMQQVFQLSAADRVLQKTPYSFDVSVWEFFWPLMTGACLVLARPGGHSDPGYLLELIGRERVTTLHFVPSMLEVFVESEGVGAGCALVRQVMSSGEALPLELVRRYQERVAARLYNLYGPTEASVDVTWWEAEAGAERVAIGRPIANTAVYVLDGGQQVVPVGVSGELYLGGSGVGRGYVGRAEQTAERFVPDPYSGRGGERLYRTGDVVRWLAEGTLEYLGRVDQQVKVRGYRIELGEIESVVGAHEGVREAVVVARAEATAGGGKRLVCYCVKAAGSAVSAVELRAHVRAQLPEYMVPAAVVFVAEMPLTGNGKVDRKALPAPQDLAGEREQQYLAPRTPLEELLAGMWGEVLGIGQVGSTDNFFEIGGDSLLATRLVSRMREAFRIELSLKWFFTTAPTIADMARSIEQRLIDEAAASELAEALQGLEEISDDEAKILLATEVGLQPDPVAHPLNKLAAVL